MKVTTNEMRAIRSALNIWNFTNGVRVETMNDIEAFRGNIPFEYGVNWACMGTKSPEETVEYVKVMTKAAQIANALNKLELIEDDDMEETIDNNACRDLAERINDHLEENPYFGISSGVIYGAIMKFRE